MSRCSMKSLEELKNAGLKACVFDVLLDDFHIHAFRQVGESAC